MPTPRMETLKTMLLDSPRNTFARYGLAMEHVNASEFDQAVTEFHTLLEIDPKYCAAYYHGGQTLEKMGRTDDAKSIYNDGLRACQQVGDAHTASEIQAALDGLG